MDQEGHLKENVVSAPGSGKVGGEAQSAQAGKGSRYKTGDIVVLKSGGPPMTVMGMRPDIYQVGWFAGSDFREEWFSEEELTQIDRFNVAVVLADPMAAILEEILSGKRPEAEKVNVALYQYRNATRAQ